MRIRVWLVWMAVLAALGPLAVVHAQTEGGLDEVTATAIANWRAVSLSMLPAQFHDVVAATYNGEPVDINAPSFNAAMIAKAQAERAAFASMDRDSVALIESYYATAQVETNFDVE